MLTGAARRAAPAHNTTAPDACVPRACRHPAARDLEDDDLPYEMGPDQAPRRPHALNELTRLMCLT